MSSNDIAVAYQSGHIYIAPDGTPFDGRRIGQLKNGVVVSTAVLSDREIDEAGLPAWAKRGNPDSNRLYGAAKENKP